MTWRLPVTVEEITDDWLAQALGPGDSTLRLKSVTRLGDLPGTASKVHLRIEYEESQESDDLPETCWVKGGFAEHSRMMAPIYAIESRFYREIAPLLDLELPRCYFAEEDPDLPQAVVILEDLQRPDIEICTVHKPLTFAQAATNLDSQARLHARWWDSPDLERGGVLDWVKHQDPMPDLPEGIYARGQLAPDTYATFMELPRGAGVSKQFHDNARMAAAMEALRPVDRDGPRCLLHADAHLGNMYFTGDGRPGFLDWQALAVGSYSHDVTYFIVSALDVATRAQWEKPLLMYYLERLRAYGASPVPDFETAWRSYVKHIVYGLFYWLVNPEAFQTESNNCAVASRFAIAALEHDTLGQLGV